MNPIAISQTSGAVLNTIKDVVKYVTASSGNVSYSDITKSMRVEPIVIVSQDLTNTEFMPDIMQTLQSLFAGYYMQAVSRVGNVNNVMAMKALDRLNPNSSTTDKSWMYGFEAFKHKLPTVTKPKVTLESFSEEKDKAFVTDMGANTKDNNVRLSENVNLSVGKIFDVGVTIAQGDSSVKVNIPISIRLMVNQVSERAIVSMLTLMSRDTTMSERWHSYRAGKISFWKDLVLAQDLITDARKMMQNDKDGSISEIFQRSNNAKMNSVFNKGSMNLASATNMYVISKEVADIIESKVGKLSSYKNRELLLKSGYCMILVVVDKTWERVTFYHRGLAVPTVVGVKDIKVSNKGGGPDIMEIMKALVIGGQPPI